MSLAGILLAAGRSTRFGESDKIAADLGGRPLGTYAADTLGALPLAMRFVVTGAVARNWPGYVALINDRPGAGLSKSIALGVAAARVAGAEAVLIALADMPFVPRDHFERLIDCRGGRASLVASSDGKRRMPPALFGADWFGELETLSGDHGARHLLDRAVPVLADPAHLRDIDTAADLIAAADHLEAGGRRWVSSVRHPFGVATKL